MKEKGPVNFQHGASAEIIRRARILRTRMTPAEALLWDCLRNKQLNRYKFRRQHPVAGYIVDFYCHQARLAIELDGGIHRTYWQYERDINRSKELERLGLKVIRFTNEQVLENTARVLEEITSEVKRQLEK